MDQYEAVDFVQFVAASAAVMRLLSLKLAKRCTALYLWVCVLGFFNLASAFIGHFTGAFFWFYFAYVPVYCLFSILAVGELFTLTFTDYPGIRTVGRWGFYTGVLVATAASFLVFVVFRRTSTRGSQHLFELEVAQRSIVFSLVVVIATILFVLSRYPLHLGWNTYVSSGFFSALFLAEAARVLIDSLQIHLYSGAIDLLEACFTTGCLLAWTYLLQPHVAPVLPVDRFSTPQEELLLKQLSSLNDLLGGTVRR
jgi:hypothetical protein